MKFAYVSETGESGFPGEVWFEVAYTLDPGQNRLRIEMRAITDEPTPINLTNHAYFNLSGHETGAKIYEHLVKLHADKYLDFDSKDNTVSGKVLPVSGTKYDLREYVRLSERIESGAQWPDHGFDNFFLLSEYEGENRKVAS